MSMLSLIALAEHSIEYFDQGLDDFKPLEMDICQNDIRLIPLTRCWTMHALSRCLFVPLSGFFW